jgi:hypothetical protein
VRPPGPAPAAGAVRPSGSAPAGGAARPSSSVPAAGAVRPSGSAPAAGAARPAEPARVHDAFGPTAETAIPQAFRTTEPPQPLQPGPPKPASGGTGAKGPRRRRVLLGVLALCVAFALAAGGTILGISLAGHHNKPTTGGTSPSAAPTASKTSALPVLTTGNYHGIKPKEIDFSADAGNVVTGITWSSWTATTAFGSGTSDIDSCIPSCAAAPQDLVATTLMLSDPVNGHFTVIRETRDNTAQAFVYPNTWPLGAS